MAALSPTSGATQQNPFGNIDSLMQMLFGGAGAGSATALPPGQTSLYQPPQTSSALTGTGSDAATNPFSSALGSNIIQNSNGSVSLNPATSSPSGTVGSTTAQPQSDPSSMFSSFQSMIAPYLTELQGISNNANTAAGQTQTSLNQNLANPVQAAPPSSQMNQTQADNDILQAVTGAVNGIGGGESYGSYWDNIQSQLTGAGFTPAMISALQPRIAAGQGLSGQITDKGGGNTSSFISNDSGSLDTYLNNFYNQPSTTTQPAVAPPTTSTSQPSTSRVSLGGMRLPGV